MRMQAPADAGDTCSHEGIPYKIGRDGVVDLPANAAKALEAHGFKVAGAPAPAASPPAGNPLQTRSTLATDRDAALRSIETADRELLLKMCEGSGLEVKTGHNDNHLRKKLRDHLDVVMPPREPAAPAGVVVDLRKTGGQSDEDRAFGPKTE